MNEELREALNRLLECSNQYQDAQMKWGLSVHSPDETVRGASAGEVFRLRKVMDGIIGDIFGIMDGLEDYQRSETLI